jgi:hypothetical protein
MADVSVFRQRYVAWAELEQQRVAREAMIEPALQTWRAEEAIPARSMSPFLAYHTHCRREVCSLAEREGERLGVRLGVIESARLAVLFCRAGL